MSFAYFNQGGKEAAARRRWAKGRLNELVAKDKQCAADGCGKRKAHGVKFCQDCLQALPEEMRDGLLALQPKAGGPEWQAMFAACLNELAMRKQGGLS